MDKDFINALPLCGFDIEVNKMFYVFIFCTLWGTAMVAILSLTFIFSLYRILKTSKNRFSNVTLKMQWMLFKTFVYSIMCYFIFILSPILGLLALVLFQVRAYSASIFCFMMVIISFHSIADYFILIYFIKPYRRFWANHLRKIFPMIFKNNVNPIVQMNNLTVYT